MKITHRGRELLDSKSFLISGLGEFSIDMDGAEDTISFIVDIKKADEGKEKLEFIPIDSSTLRIILTNWNNPLGTTLTEEIEVGTYDGRRLYVLFSVKKVGDKGEIRSFIFSAYLGEEVQDGDN